MTKNNPNIIMMTTLGWRIAAFRAIPSIHVEKSMTTVKAESFFSHAFLSGSRKYPGQIWGLFPFKSDLFLFRTP